MLFEENTTLDLLIFYDKHGHPTGKCHIDSIPKKIRGASSISQQSSIGMTMGYTLIKQKGKYFYDDTRGFRVTVEIE